MISDVPHFRAQGSGRIISITCPNVETRMIATIPADKRAEIENAIPMGRFADPREMADAIAFLASQEAGYITGVILPVDGGVSIWLLAHDLYDSVT